MPSTKMPLPTPTAMTPSTTAAAAAARAALAMRSRPGGDLANALEHDLRRTEPDEQPQARNHDAEVVHLADHRQEIGNDVERPHHVGERGDQQRLGEHGNARVAEQTPV